MRNNKAFLGFVSVLLIAFQFGSVRSMTLEYSTTAEALAEVGFYELFGLVVDADRDSDEAINARAYASTHYDKIQYAGEVGISARALATIEPNEINLLTRINGSYSFDVGWVLMEYFYQDANGTIEGLLQVDEFPVGAPCRLQVDISFPYGSWTGNSAWQFYMESSQESFLAGRDELGNYGSLSGTVDTFAGEPVYVFLGIAGRGYADHNVGDQLGFGTLAVNAALTAIEHPADLNADGWINFVDFTLFSWNWQQDCDDPNMDFCQQADFDLSGKVDANDLEIFTQYWLLSSDPNQIQ